MMATWHTDAGGTAGMSLRGMNRLSSDACNSSNSMARTWCSRTPWWRNKDFAAWLLLWPLPLPTWPLLSQLLAAIVVIAAYRVEARAVAVAVSMAAVTVVAARCKAITAVAIATAVVAARCKAIAAVAAAAGVKMSITAIAAAHSWRCLDDSCHGNTSSPRVALPMVIVTPQKKLLTWLTQLTQ